MNRPLKRPPHPSSGEAAIGPQTMDEIIRRLNQSQGVQLPKQGLQLRWFRPLSDDEFGDKQAAVNQPATDDKPILFDDENLLHFRDLNRYSGDDVPAYCPSMWCMWVESDVEASDQAPLDMDPMERCIEVYFPMYAWARNNANAEASQKNVEILKRILMSKRDKGRFPAAFNTRTGRWECVSLTEALPAQIWAIPSTTIPPADKIGGTARELKSGFATFWVNDSLGPPVVHDIVPGPNNTTKVYNWLTETPLESGEVYLFWLDVTTGYYMVDPGAEAQPGTGEVHHLMVCDPDINECCVYDALKLVYTPIDGKYCAVDVDREKIWVRCTNGWTGNLPKGYCRLGVKIKDSLICNGDDRPVYQFDCGSCLPCMCPYGCDEIDFEFHADGTACQTLFEGFAGKLKCLDQPPWTFVPELGRKGWWGEFKVAGMMPRMVYSAEVTCEEDDPNNPGQTINVQKEIWLEVDCGGQNETPGTILGHYIDDANGNLVPFTKGGNCTYTAGLRDCRVMTDENGEYQFIDRSYNMGVWVECQLTEGGMFDEIRGPWVFWLADDDVLGALGLTKETINPECDDLTPDGEECVGTGVSARTVIARTGTPAIYACGVWSTTGAWIAQDCCANTVTSLGTLYGQDCFQYACSDDEDAECYGHDCLPIPALGEVNTALPGNGVNHCVRCKQCCAVLLGCWWNNDVDPCDPVYEGIPSPPVSVTLSWPMRGIFDAPPA